jgi:succinyl-CoA synthetase beta subunit
LPSPSPLRSITSFTTMALRRMIPTFARAPASFAQRAPAIQSVQKRYLNIHEYQSAQLMEEMGVNVPLGFPATTVQEAVAAAAKIGDEFVVIKSQILAGGRGLGKFTNGLQGGVHIIKTEEVAEYAEKMLGGTLVTKQSGEAGKPVNCVLVAKKMDLINEMYFAILLDRSSGGPVIIACSKGGTSIEDLAHTNPELIVKVPIHPIEGITDAQAAEVVRGLKCTTDEVKAAEQIKCLYRLFVEKDCTMVEVNPLAEDSKGVLMAADAKIGFDDNAAFRQTAVFAKRDESQEDPREVAAGKWDLNYIGLDGNIGCMVNGAGLAMATMDIIQLNGGKPANFLDVGGNASEKQVTEAFKVITSDPTVKALLVNIFGGIMKCDVIAAGIVSACNTLTLTIPLIVRLEGTNVEAGKKILADSGLNIISAEDLDDAAAKAVAAIAK